jgi:hypothetical protein
MKRAFTRYNFKKQLIGKDMENNLITQITLPHISFDMPNEQYHRGAWQKEFISSTTLKNFLVSPKFFKWSMTNPHQIGLAASQEGSLYHAMLESIGNTGSIDDIYKEFFVFYPPCNPKTGEPYGKATKAYTEAYNEQMEANCGKTPVSEEDIQKTYDMVTALLNNCGTTSEMVNFFLEKGTPEVSFFLEYNGGKFKFRSDIMSQSKIVDWKTITADDLHQDTIARQIAKMDYGFSAAFYQFFCHQITGVWKEFYWVFQQKSAPYDAVVVSADDWAYSVDYTGALIKGPSAIEFENVLEQYLSCVRNNYFPGAECMVEPTVGNYRIMYALPNYKRNSVINFY